MLKCILCAFLSIPQIDVSTEFHFVLKFSQGMLTGIHNRYVEHTWASPVHRDIWIDGYHPELPPKNVWPKGEFERSGLDDVIGIA